jgi:putative component of membrane protein insertase Oxa1/YidC/SpoIIIJ protein YidD
MRIQNIAYVLSFSFSQLIANGQLSKEISVLRSQIIIVHEDSVNKLKIHENEGGSIPEILFRAYKIYISSQDIANCVFSPSCSEYALEAVNNQGILIGLLNSLDRLTRCSGCNDKYYPLKSSKFLRIDPVRNINYEEK